MPSDRLLVETDDCVASKEVSAQIQKHSIPDWLLLRCRNNLFQFIQGTSGDFSQQFNFACESSAQMGYIAKEFNRLQTGKQ